MTKTGRGEGGSPSRGAIGRERWRAAAAGAALLLLAACGSGGDATSDPPPAAQEPPATALALARPGELLTYVQQRLRTRPAGGGATLYGGAPGGTFVDINVVLTTQAGSAAADAGAQRSAPLAQEAGVDEADLLQSDGTRLYSLQPQGSSVLRLQVHAREAGGARLLQTLELGQPDESGQLVPNLQSPGMHLAADGRSLVVLGQSWELVRAGLDRDPLADCGKLCASVSLPWGLMRSSVLVQRVDSSSPGDARAGERLLIDGQLVDSRRIGNRLYLVSTHQPLLAADLLPATATAAQREQAIAALSNAELLPRVRRNGGAPVPLLNDTECWLQTGNASDAVRFTVVTVLDMTSPTLAASSRCFAGGAEALYLSQEALYLATTRMRYVEAGPALVYPGEMRTDIHKFALVPAGVDYRASGDVPGHLGWDAERKPLRLSEYNGDLRVLSFTGSEGWFTIQDAVGKSASPATLTVLRERSADHSLQTLATLPNARRPAPLGKPGEQVYGVRLVGDRGYVVTFRRTDPLYLLDLSDPSDPRAVGELELAGFSEQLYPLPGGLLLGAGRDADERGRVTGLKMALFDVADPARPQVLASFSSGGAGSQSALDASRHGLNYLLKDGVARIALPVSLTPPGPTFAPGGWVTGLQRFEVDTAARTMRERPLLPSGAASNGVWLDRSLQIGDQVFYLGGGALSAHAW